MRLDEVVIHKQMEVYIPTHVSMAIGEAVLRSIVKDLGTIERGRAILAKFGVSTVDTAEDMESVTLDSLLDKILPREDCSEEESDDESDDESDVEDDDESDD